MTEWQRNHRVEEKHQKFNMSTSGKLPANLDFLFRSRLYFEHTAMLVLERRTGGQVRRDGL